MRNLKGYLVILASGMMLSSNVIASATELNTTETVLNSGAIKLGSASFWFRSTFADSLGSSIINPENVASLRVGDSESTGGSSAKPADSSTRTPAVTYSNRPGLSATETQGRFSSLESKPWGRPRGQHVAQSLPNGTIPFGVDVPQPAPPQGDGIIENSVPSAINGRKSFALTLAGGGARGAAHIGVLKVLEREGLRPAFVSGSSIGAVIGSLYCAGVPVAEIEKLMLSGKVRKAFMPIPIKIQAIWSVPRDICLRLLQRKPQVGLYSGRSISKFIDKNIPPSVRRMEDMIIPFAVIATNILDTRATWIAHGDVGEAVRASASIPYVYKPVLLDGKALVDGGMRANLPTEAARASGAPVVVAVKLHSSLESKPASDFRSILKFSDRIMSIMMAEIESKNMNDADVLIEPNIDDFKLYSFDRDILESAIEAGEKAAQKVLPQLRVALQRGPSRTAGVDNPQNTTR